MNLSKGEQAWRSFLDRMEMASQIESISRLEAARMEMVKDAGFRIRVERDLREKFIEMCRAQDRPAAQVIRDFMRQYIKDNAVTNDTNAAQKNKGHS